MDAAIKFLLFFTPSLFFLFLPPFIIVVVLRLPRLTLERSDQRSFEVDFDDMMTLEDHY